MTTLAPPNLTRPDAPTYSVWDVVAAHVELSGMVRPLPRPCEPLPWCRDYDAGAVWDAILPAPAPIAVAVASVHASAVAVAQSGPSVTFGDVSIGGDTITVVGTPARAPEPIAPVPLPAAGLLLICAVVALPLMKRMRR